MDITSVAQYLGVTERTVYNKVRAGDLPALKVGRLWRVRRSDLEGWLSAAPYRSLSPTASGGLLAGESGFLLERSALDSALLELADPLERRLTFVAMLTSGVEALGWPAPVVVGGHAVEFYTAGGYTTVDIDLAGASEPIGQVLESWGFERTGRHWFDTALGLVLEVPGSSLGPAELSHCVLLRIGGATAHVLGIEDLVVDRLAACVHWQDADSCQWAARLLAVAEDLDTDYLRLRAHEEDVTAALATAMGEAGR
ncbi:MAG: helix-turn-helix domain-containing protein [Coriobacteriia bacterium]|nr:helix-turn-helix domain-containing protein [Coriobacteriia bacterium]